MVNWIHAVMFILQMLCCDQPHCEPNTFRCAGSALLESHTRTNRVAITLQQSIKKQTLSVLSLNVSYYSQVYSLFSLSPVRLWVFTVRLSCSDQTSWADWGSHEGTFKQRRCSISPRVKHHFYFWHHKAVFKNNWEPTAVDSWKWSFGRGCVEAWDALAAVK